jgi:hypothetical protein
MSKAKEQKPGYGKILDAWIAPQEAGEPVGCIATTFTFSPAFFEVECLGRFLQIESDASEDGPAYLIEREEKICQLSCAAALVDQHHAQGTRNLHWDLLPARLTRGILHAKVSLLYWTNRARLIVASANLTEDGYRRNQEAFAVLDYYEGSEAPLPAFHEITAFLREAARHSSPSAEISNPATARWGEFLDKVETAARGWGVTEAPRWLSQQHVFTVLTGPERKSALAALRETWPDNSPPNSAFVISPFFDPPDAPNEPAIQLWTLLKQRGDARVEFQVAAEDIPGEKAVLIHAPKSLLDAQPASRTGTETFLSRLKLEQDRPLHAKCLWLENENVVLSLIGSSNFTSAGLGLGKTQNLEANLAFAVGKQNRDACRALENAWLDTEEFPEGVEKRWQPLADDGEDSAGLGLVPLPSAFGYAIYGSDEKQRGFVEFTFSGSPPPKWALIADDERDVFLDETGWVAHGSPQRLRLDWPRERAPSGFRVTWTDSAGSAWWPVNLECSRALPSPEKLRNLSLEALIDILTSAKPLHRAMERWVGSECKKRRDADDPVLDPLKRVDSTGFLLQRTRRVSDALTALRQRLERPVISEQALEWRLRGPVGALAFGQAIAKEARSDQERWFLLTELCLELGRVHPQTSAGSLTAQRVRSALCGLMNEIRATIPIDALASQPALANYAAAAFQEVLR